MEKLIFPIIPSTTFIFSLFKISVGKVVTPLQIIKVKLFSSLKQLLCYIFLWSNVHFTITLVPLKAEGNPHGLLRFQKKKNVMSDEVKVHKVVYF